MKKIAFVPCYGGLLKPISNFTEARIQLVIQALESKSYDFLFISINGFQEEQRQAAFDSVRKYFTEENRSHIHVCLQSGCYAESLLKFIESIDETKEVCIDAVTKVAERGEIYDRILTKAQQSGKKLPLIFTC
jgi:hypothetical protein